MSDNWELPTEEIKEERRKWTDDEEDINKVSSKIDGIKFAPKIIQLADRIKNFEIRPDDIWIVTFPKCGTTWTQEIVWQFVNGVKREATKTYLFRRSPFFECEAMDFNSSKGDSKNQDNICMNSSIDWTEQLPSPRVIKSHLSFGHLPDEILTKAKVIYVARNPLDVVVSYWHHRQTWRGYTGELKTFAQAFKEGENLYGSIWDHFKDGLKHIDNPNFKFIWYEDMKKDSEGVIKELMKFTGYTLTDDKMSELLDITSVGSMRDAWGKTAGDNEMLKKKRMQQIRKGQVGDSKNHFNEQELDEWTKWMNENAEKFGVQLPE